MQAPRKVALVAGLIRQQSVQHALVILQRTPKRPATALIKMLKSAQAVGRNNYQLQADSLQISEIFVTTGNYKRLKYRMMRPRRRGQLRYRPQVKRSSHVTMRFEGVKQEAVKK